MPGCVEAPRLAAETTLRAGLPNRNLAAPGTAAPAGCLSPACATPMVPSTLPATGSVRGCSLRSTAAIATARHKKWGRIKEMFSHVMIGTNDLEKAKVFYDALLGTLGVRPAKVDGHRIFYFTKTGVFSVSKPINGEPATHANGGTIGFAAESPEQADAWHAAGLANGGKTCENPPGIREGSAGKMYLAYLRDLDGNKICAMHRMAT